MVSSSSLFPLYFYSSTNDLNKTVCKMLCLYPVGWNTFKTLAVLSAATVTTYDCVCLARRRAERRQGTTGSMCTTGMDC